MFSRIDLTKHVFHFDSLADGTTKEMEFMHYTDVKQVQLPFLSLLLLRLIAVSFIFSSWPELKDQPIDDTRLRHDQVSMRLAEFDGVIETLKIISGSIKVRDNKGRVMEDFRGKDWEGSLDTERIILAGHSLGGTAVVRLFVFCRLVSY